MKTVIAAITSFLLNLVALFLFAHAALASGLGPSAPNSQALNLFLSFLTNCPTINNSLIEMTLGRNGTPTQYQFRYQSNAFYAREFCSSNHAVGTICESDVTCGRWEDEYWYYNPLERERLLYRYRLAPNPLSFIPCGRYQQYDAIFGMFQSVGFSDLGPNSLVPRNSDVVLIDRQRKATSVVQLELSNGIPWKAVLRRQFDRGQMHTFVSELFYNTNIAPLGIPAITRVNTDETVFKIRSITFGPALRSKDMFLPPHLFIDTNLAQVLYSNNTHYYSKAGKSHRMDRLPAPNDLGARDNQFLVFGFIALSVLIVPLWIVVRKRIKSPA